MKINLLLGETLTAVLAGAHTTTAPLANVSYGDTLGSYTSHTALNGTTAVTLVTGGDSTHKTVVDGVSIVNRDTASATVTVNHVVSGVSYPIATIVLAAGDTLVIGSAGMQVLDSSGNVKLAFASSATTFTGDITISAGKDLIFSGTTGQPEIHVPDNLADALSFKIEAGADIFTVDTSTGAVVFSFGATVRLNVLGDAQIGNATSDLVAFHGATPTDQCAAYTQTYATATRTQSNLTVGADLGAFTDPPSAAEMAALRTFVNALKADLTNVKQVSNSLIDDLQEKGLVG